MNPPKLILAKGEACLPCRRRKHRCDAVKPVCGTCAKSRGAIDCVYAIRCRKTLEQRILELESYINTLTVVSPAAAPNRSKHAASEGARISSSLRPTLPPAPTSVPANKLSLDTSPCAAIVQSLEEPEIASWRTEQEIPCGARNHLIALFIRFRRSHSFEFNAPRLLFLLGLPPSHHRAPHPALSNAIMLYGCLYAEDALRQLFERALVHRVRKDLQNALAHADRLVDCTRALTLLGCYFYGMFKPLVGHYYVSAAMSLAVACGLHRIKSLDLNPQDALSLIDPAVDLIELGDRINLFWTILSLDRMKSLLCEAVPCGPRNEDITSLLPCPSEYYEYASASLQQHGASWASHGPESPFGRSSSESPLALRVKAYTLFSKATLLLAQSQKSRGGLDDHLVADARSTMDAISALTNRLEAFQPSGVESTDISSTKSALLAAVGAAHAAMIQVNDIFPKDDLDVFVRQKSACMNVVLAAREICKLGYEYFPLILGIALVPAYQFLVRTTRNEDGGRSVQELLCSLDRVKTLMPSEANAPVDHMWHHPVFV
ncbi:hypothetical protein BOTBODRAFT_38310 [Botryobasidium botryosum FD-172 SS1]|uniref:Zn(2)-C6 fungal-type domain-containing protein n=1 Tax=Botryobasidium botryosum (strain FD-172 SS1) TaxID=930990 RepID=A0A067LX60_BOTB1|nr:hypothetical protein BOTBODRAFT_38310 [Botryobasidium botryosum FD-172 SS1]